jgi:hypothetical protein
MFSSLKKFQLLQCEKISYVYIDDVFFAPQISSYNSTPIKK